MISAVWARSTLTGPEPGQVAARVQADIRGGNIVTATTTVGSAERLEPAAGKQVTVIIKASDVMAGTGD